MKQELTRLLDCPTVEGIIERGLTDGTGHDSHNAAVATVAIHVRTARDIEHAITSLEATIKRLDAAATKLQKAAVGLAIVSMVVGFLGIAAGIVTTIATARR